MFKKQNLYKFLILLPIIDLITSITTRMFNTSLSVGILIKSLFLIIMLYYLFFRTLSKHKKLCISYIILIFIYIICYYLSKIKYLTINTFITETTYLIKLLYLPMILPCLYCYFDDNKLSKNELGKILKNILIIYSILLFIPLITNTGYSTYYNGIGGTIGWFYSANEISVLLVILFPFTYLVDKNNKIISIILPIIIILIISTIGTKSSMVGLIIDTFIIFIISLFYKNNKNRNRKLIISTLIISSFTIFVFMNSNSLDNIKLTFTVQEKQNMEEYIENKQQEENLIKEEIERLEKEVPLSETINKFINTYGKALLSDRDIFFKVTYMLYKKNYNINTLLFGIGYTNNKKISNFAITKLIEMDPLDIYLHSGLVAIIIILLPFIYFIYYVIRLRKINIKTIFYTLMLCMTFCISLISGHTLMAPQVSIYIALYYILCYFELGKINEFKNDLKDKVTIYALHLGYGGIEKDIVNKANMLSKLYDVEIISVYKINDLESNLNKKVKVKYLTNIKPNKKEFINALKKKNIIKILKEGLYSIKVLYLKDLLLTNSMINCDSKIIISTRVDFSLKLVNYNEYSSIKIAQEHIYHNNNDKYLNKLYKILSKIDYLMPSSNYLTEYYKDLFIDYRYKIKTNDMYVETDNKISKLKNKNIISVGRLEKVKAFDELIKIFKTVHEKNPDWTLSIVGNGSEYDNLNNLINELNLKDSVKLLGNKDKDELNKLYSEASIYVMTSIEESFGLVLLEAASHGLPIISYSRALGAKEIIKDNGILIDNENDMINNINKLIDNIDLRKEYQNKSLKISEYYSYEFVEKNNLEFYKNINKNTIFNNLYLDSQNNFYKLVDKIIKNKEKMFIVTANPETYMLSLKDKEINDIIYNKNNYIIPDGTSIVKSAKLFDLDINERITGIDLSTHLLELADKNKYKVYLFGAKESVMDKLETIINTKYPNIKLVGSTNGYVQDKDAVFEYIKSVKPDIVLLGLGIPLQEKLINKHISSFDKGIFVGVGGSFDVLSGDKLRAPKIFIKLNLEWLYRILKEPKRITRFLKYNVKYVFKVIKEKNNR